MTTITSLDAESKAFTIHFVAQLLVSSLINGIDEMDSLDHARLCQKCIAILKQLGVDTPELPRLPQWRERPNV